ncbi:MAG: primosomal protein N', partial [Rickettsiales bacterium]|nr:primosomal protein N' [Rickettsiales bacterium]
MFNANDIVKILVPIAIGEGYDYRLTDAADVGAFVRVPVARREYIGVIIGAGDSKLPPEKIKNATPIALPCANSPLAGESQSATRDAVGGKKCTDKNYVIPPTDGKPSTPPQGGSYPGLSPTDIKWIFRMSDWTMMPPGSVLKLILNVPDVFRESKRKPKAESRKPIEYRDTGNIKLNAEQSDAACRISVHGSRFTVHVLDGITGSGKTQVYFDAVWRTYATGRAVLIMMPEIALTAQFISRFADRFGAPPVVWHSNLTPAQRRDIWRAVASGDIRIVVGTRSALFLPWQNLGLIVVDEEHDSSYKQEELGNYHARDMAILRASIAGFPIILASATPSMETIKKVNDGAYQCSRLTTRFGGAQMPRIEIVDLRIKDEGIRMKDENNSNSSFCLHPSSLSPALCRAISETLTAGQQTMLFLNRRGYAPMVQCKKCGWVAQCPDCSCGLTLHRNKNCKLLCHICGHTEPAPRVCPECGRAELSATGIGVEKIAEQVHEIWPTARVAIVSSDTVASRDAIADIVARMEKREIDIIIGTQILAKGHHFPNLTLVGVVDADAGLFGTDFRAAEKTFQQLFQVAGRAGRGEIPGRVMLQTYQPEHPVIRAIANGDRDEFMTGDLNARNKAVMPPYGQMIALIIESQRESALTDFCKKLSDAAPKLSFRHPPLEGGSKSQSDFGAGLNYPS